MAEPTSTTGAAGAALIGIGVSLAGSKYGPLFTAAVAALIGAIISLGEVAVVGMRAGAWYVIKYVSAATILSGTLSYLVERFTGVPAVEILALVAFLIGWIGNRWQGLLQAFLGGLQTLAGRKGAGQ